jgi:hypothetical protein
MLGRGLTSPGEFIMMGVAVLPGGALGLIEFNSSHSGGTCRWTAAAIERG